MRPVVIANGDHGLGEDEVDYRREASIGLMNHDGLVERGRVGRTSSRWIRVRRSVPATTTRWCHGPL
ncbi:MAG: hypothetical protein R2789_07330 [Microthrixaceae bacterium]